MAIWPEASRPASMALASTATIFTWPRPVRNWTIGEDKKPGKFGAGAWFQTGKFKGFDGQPLEGANGIYLFGSQRLYYENPAVNNNGLSVMGSVWRDQLGHCVDAPLFRLWADLLRPVAQS